MDNHYEWRETPTYNGVSWERLDREGVRLAEEAKSKISLETWLKVGFAASLFLSVILISLVSLDKETVFSPYEEDQELSNLQLTEMRNTLGSDGEG